MNRSKSLIFAVAAVAVLTGCATQLQQPVQRTSSDTHHFQKNYQIGAARTVNVGEPMVKLQDYWVETVEAPVMVPDRAITLQGGIASVSLAAGGKYPVRGTYVLDGATYTAVAASDNPTQHSAVLVKPDGTLHNRILATSPGLAGYVMVVYTMTISDPGARLIRESKESIVTKRGYENFELMYTGITANSLNLTYREFSPEGLARVAFFQNLTYEANAKAITFQKYRIAVEKATSESITFSVLQDGR